MVTINNLKERVTHWFLSKHYNYKRFDFLLVMVVIILFLISSFILSIIPSSGQVGSMKRQIFTIGMGLCVILVFSLIDYHTLCMYVPILYIITTLMVAGTRFSPLGTNNNTDSYRWLDFKIFKFQPSEVCKIVVILALASFFLAYREKMESFKTFFLACAIALLPTAFILVQSDLSSSVVIIVVLAMMILCSGMSKKIIGPVVAVLIPIAGFLIWYIQQPGQKLLQGYQLRRITGWLHPETEALGIMYQQNNSVLSIASGKLYGKLLMDGLGENRNYNSVDVIESDFVWTPISEEFGFIGCLIILGLLSIIIIKCFIAAKNARDYLGMMIALGIGSLFCFQTFFNIGVVTSLLPNTGLPLPFLSNGLSSMLSNSMAIGILINIQIQPTRGNSSSFVESLALENNLSWKK
ncbi:MAG: FtsW/RodA/SpoVE family cell cycle protein [Clostridiales bacterium]|nr:FtsW/RodA/SpoVE family cell cycle protein [Clostridiales bacterium]